MIWIEPEPLVKNGWLTNSSFLFGPSRGLLDFNPIRWIYWELSCGQMLDRRRSDDKQTDIHFRKNLFFTEVVSKRKDWFKILEAILYIKQIPSHSWWECKNLIYVPQARKLVFPLQLRVTQCYVFRYRGIQCKNWTAHAHMVLQRNTIFFLFFFFVQR